MKFENASLCSVKKYMHVWVSLPQYIFTTLCLFLYAYVYLSCLESWRLLWFLYMNVWVYTSLHFLDGFSSNQKIKNFTSDPHCQQYIWSWPTTYLDRFIHATLCMHTGGSPCTISTAKIAFRQRWGKHKKGGCIYFKRNRKTCVSFGEKSALKWKANMEGAEVFKSAGETRLQGFSAHKLMIACHQDEFGWHLRWNGSK